MDLDFYYPEKAEECWAGDPYMLEKTKDYGKQAREFGESFDHIPTDHHPWVDNDNPRWLPRLRLFDLEDRSLPTTDQPQQFESARDLYSFLRESRTARENPKRQKHLIILEDIDPRFAEVLGVMLGVPPAFFISHCDTQLSLSILDSTYAKVRSSRHWKIRVPSRRVAKDLPGGDFILFAGNCVRSCYDVDNTSSFQDYDTAVSYWGQDHGEDSWTAIIVVDPWQAYVLPANDSWRDPSEAAIYLDKVEEFECLRALSSIVMAQGTSYTVRPQKESMFDFLVEAHERSSHECPLDPFLATAYARNFVAAVWEDYIAHDIRAIQGLVWNNQEIDNTYSAIQARDRRIITGYQELIVKRYVMNFHRKIITDIAWAFQSRWDSSLPVSSCKCIRQTR
ncbi:d0a5852b-4d16-46fc-bfde-1d460b4017e5 [Sclerotinia trifoliorum]|uniref:D0a5852b-4d16-46fc-bfde-1d460b4017e5 n=1 Tax=Sclerotinia trifoliorum TaxID=28548 RepID=A0A8H2ZSA0_9HELO|nr:d0a5852b-4d16-46fc-bfde-1d460b4017e5 [Sclerotinia trifoliorum]